MWQIDVRSIAWGGQAFAVFTDFREPGEEGDNDWNIYFSRSEDNGKTSSKNTRLNDVQAGRDELPFLTTDQQGVLYAVWKTGRDSVLGDIAFSHSTDGGRSWPRSIKVNPETGLTTRIPTALAQVTGGKLIYLWDELSLAGTESRQAWLLPVSGNSVATPPLKVLAGTAAPPTPRLGKTLFEEDFANGDYGRWEVKRGVWLVVDGALMGVEPQGQEEPLPFFSFARFEEPQSYSLRGRFKLDPVEHFMANIYFRADPASGKYYVIGNGFRTGVCLSLRTHDTPMLRVYEGPFMLDGEPLVERRYPFQNNCWYEFQLVVTPQRVDYFVEGNWMLSLTDPLILEPGRFGVGGVSRAPAYFDDIVVSTVQPLDPSADRSDPENP